MSAVAPKVRGACENCHRRKIRCILTSGDNACQNCDLSGVSCLFAPRGKPGRVPQRRNHEGDVRNSTSYIHEPIQQQQQQQQRASSARQDEMALITPGESPGFGLAFPNSDSDGSMTSAWARTDMMQGHDSESLPYFNQWPDMSQVGHLLSPQASLHRIQLDDSASNGVSSVLSDYSFLLSACNRMHEYCKPRPGTAVNTMYIDHDLLSTMAKTCAAAASAAGPRDTSTQQKSATAALVSATLFKVLELCDVVVSRLSKRSPTDPRPRIEELSTLKHLDLVLLQAKVSFTLEDQHSGVQKSVELHRAIMSLVDKDFGNWHWYD